MSRPPSMFVYGAGRVGLAIAGLARERDVEVVGLWNPRPLRPERAALAGGFRLEVEPDPPAGEAELWLVAVPDDAIASTARGLARATGLPPTAAHCAGAHGWRLLAPLAERGVACGSWHPAMTFRGAPGDAGALAGAVVAVEGQPAALGPLEALAAALGLETVHVAEDRKPRYHAALVLAASGRIGLDAAAHRLLASAGFDPPTARAVLGPLVRRTDENLARALPDEALTGPVARGDAVTVERQLAALADDPLALELYRALGALALDLVPERFENDGHRAVARLMGVAR